MNTASGDAAPAHALRTVGLDARLTLLSEALDNAAEGEADALFVAMVETLPGLEASAARRLSDRAHAIASEVRVLAALHARKLSPTRREVVSLLVNGYWDDVLPALVSRGRAGRIAAADLLSEHMPRRHVGVLPQLFIDADKPQSAAAEDALLKAIATMLPDRGDCLGPVLGRSVKVPIPARTDTTCEYRARVCRAVGESLEMFGEHHRARGVLVGAIAILSAFDQLTEAGDTLLRVLRTPAHPAPSALATLVRTSPAPIARRFAWRWLGLAQGRPDSADEPSKKPDALSRACADRAARAETKQEHEAVLRVGAVAIRPRRSSLLSRVGPPAESEPGLPTRAMLAKICPGARTELSRLHDVMPALPATTSATHRALLSEPAPIVRLHACRTSGVGEREDWLFDAHSAVSTHAVLAWSAAGVGAGGIARSSDPARRRLAGFAIRSGVSTVRSIAQDELDATDPFAGTPASRLRARRWAHADPSGFVEAVHARLRSEHDAERAVAVRLVGELGMASRFEHELIALCDSDADTRTLASVVRLLGSCVGSKAAGAIEAMLEHGDNRVRANGVEAIDLWHREGASVHALRLMELKTDDRAARVRANALVAWGRHGAGGDRDVCCNRLRTMLRDVDAGNRSSAAWAAGRLLPAQGEALGESWSVVAQDIAERSDLDESDRVRSHCKRGVHRLLAHLHAAGHGAAGGLSAAAAELVDEDGT